MKILTNVTMGGNVDMASNAKDQFTIGSELERDNPNADELNVWANANFNNDVNLGSSSADVITAKGQFISNNSLTISGNIVATGSLNAEGLQTKFYNISPNNVVPVLAFEATGTTQHVDLAFIPKNLGAFSIGVADNTAVGGNKRGLRSVDLQVSRNNSNEVASGENSTIVGGAANIASEYLSTQVGGLNNFCVGGGGTIIGSNNSAIDTNTYFNSIINGFSCATLSGSIFSVIIGGFESAMYVGSQYSVILGGYRNRTDAPITLASGEYSTTKQSYGRQVRASGQFNDWGDAQTSNMILRGVTTGSSPLILTSNNQLPSGSAPYNFLHLPSNNAYKVKAEIIAKESTTDNVKSWTLEAIFQRDATLKINGNVNGTVLTADVGTSNWDCSLVPINGADVQVTGETGKTINWVAKIESVEVVI